MSGTPSGIETLVERSSTGVDKSAGQPIWTSNIVRSPKGEDHGGSESIPQARPTLYRTLHLELHSPYGGLFFAGHPLEIETLVTQAIHIRVCLHHEPCPHSDRLSHTNPGFINLTIRHRPILHRKWNFRNLAVPQQGRRRNYLGSHNLGHYQTIPR